MVYRRAAAIWLLQSALAALLLLLLWQPAVTTTELKPQQDIIAFLVDDSRSMSIAEDGSTRQKQAVDALQDGVLASVGQKFQTRLYRFDAKLTPASFMGAWTVVDRVEDIVPALLAGPKAGAAPMLASLT